MPVAISEPSPNTVKYLVKTLLVSFILRDKIEPNMKKRKEQARKLFLPEFKLNDVEH